MSPDESWFEMNTTQRKTFTGVTTAIVVAGLTATGVATPALAATSSVTDVCDAIILDLTGYSTIPDQPATTERVLVTEATTLVPAIYGEPPLVTPATNAVPAVFDNDYRYISAHPVTGESTGQEKWFKNEAPADPSVWKLIETRTTEITAAVQAQPAVYGPAPLLSPEVPARDAVYEDKMVPAVSGNATPNSMTLYIDDEVGLEAAFGSDYDASVAVDGTSAHTYSVVISGYGMADIAPILGATEACVITPPIDIPSVDIPSVDIPPVEEPVDEPVDEPVVDEPVEVPPVVSLPVMPPVVPPAAAAPAAATPAAATPAARTEVLPRTGVASWTPLASILAAVMMLAGIALTLRRRHA